MQVRRFIAGEVENALVHGIQRNLRAGDRRSGVVIDAQQNLYFLAGLVIGVRQISLYVQSRAGPFHFQFAITNAIFCGLNFARAVRRTAQQHYGDKHIGRVAFQQRHLNGRRVPSDVY